jgi:hypothetical protein
MSIGQVVCYLPSVANAEDAAPLEMSIRRDRPRKVTKSVGKAVAAAGHAHFVGMKRAPGPWDRSQATQPSWVAMSSDASTRTAALAVRILGTETSPSYLSNR